MSFYYLFPELNLNLGALCFCFILVPIFSNMFDTVITNTAANQGLGQSRYTSPSQGTLLKGIERCLRENYAQEQRKMELRV